MRPFKIYIGYLRKEPFEAISVVKMSFLGALQACSTIGPNNPTSHLDCLMAKLDQITRRDNVL